MAEESDLVLSGEKLVGDCHVQALPVGELVVAQVGQGEGVRSNNLFGTHLTGPALMKNPHFLEYVAELILGRKPETAYLVHEKAGYEITLTELTKRMNES